MLSGLIIYSHIILNLFMWEIFLWVDSDVTQMRVKYYLELFDSSFI